MGVEVETITPPPNPEDKPVKGWCYSQIHLQNGAREHHWMALGKINENNHKRRKCNCSLYWYFDRWKKVRFKSRSRTTICISTWSRKSYQGKKGSSLVQFRKRIHVVGKGSWTKREVGKFLVGTT